MSPAADGGPTVRVVVVSHSAALAGGVVELARQMAPDVDLVAAGGTDDGGLGTSFDRITAALQDPPAAGAVVLYDLGSALLTTETALELLEPETAERVDVIDAPLVEGALAAATAAQGGADRAAVGAAAAAAAGSAAAAAGSAGATDGSDAGGDAGEALPAESARATLRNPLGLHARPAAQLARALADVDAHVTVGAVGGRSADARNVLDVVRLALRGGTEVQVRAAGPAAQRAVTVVGELISDGFGEADGPPDVAAEGPAGGDRRDGPRPGAPGQAVGPLLHAGTVAPPADDGDAPHDAAAEQRRLDESVRRAAAGLGRGDALAQLRAALLTDETLRTSARAGITAGAGASQAWWKAVGDVADSLADETDDVVAGRAADVREAGAAVLRELGVAASSLPADVAGRVLAATDLGPGELGEFAARGGAAVVLAGGTPTAHAVIVARGLGLPVVLRAGPLLADVADGTVVAVDGAAGTVEVDPPDAAARMRGARGGGRGAACRTRRRRGTRRGARANGGGGRERRFGGRRAGGGPVRRRRGRAAAYRVAGARPRDAARRGRRRPPTCARSSPCWPRDRWWCACSTPAATSRSAPCASIRCATVSSACGACGGCWRTRTCCTPSCGRSAAPPRGTAWR